MLADDREKPGLPLIEAIHRLAVGCRFHEIIDNGGLIKLLWRMSTKAGRAVPLPFPLHSHTGPSGPG